MAISRIIVLLNLKPGKSAADYEALGAEHRSADGERAEIDGRLQGL